MKKEYWIVSAQLPFHLIKGIFKSEREAIIFEKKVRKNKKVNISISM